MWLLQGSEVWGVEVKGSKSPQLWKKPGSQSLSYLLLPPGQMYRRGGKEEEGRGLTLTAGAPTDRDGIQSDVQISCAAPDSFKCQLREGGGSPML